MASITALPTPPSRLRPATFNPEADAWDAALYQFSVEAALFGAEISAAVDVVTSGLSAALWANTGATYAIGDKRYSPLNGLLYRRLTASSAGTTDPSVDTTNWALMSVQAPPLVTHGGTSAVVTLNAHNEFTNAAQCTATFPASPSAGAWFWLGFQNERADNILGRNSQLIMKQANDLQVGRIYHGGFWRFVGGAFGWRLMAW